MTNVQKQPWRKENNKDIFRMKISKILFSVFSFFLFSNSFSQKNIDNQSFVWTRYNNQLEFNPKWSLQSEVDNRVFWKEFKQNTLVVRSQIRNKIDEKVEWGAGFVYLGTKTLNSDATSSFILPEYRAQQDVTFKQKISKIALSHRYMVEERFFQNANKDGFEEGINFRWRLRYRLQADCFLWKKEQQSLKAILSEEIMINAGNKVVKNIFDQNRVYAALLLGVNESLGFEIGYLSNFQQRSTGTDFYNNDIVRVTIFQKLKF